MDKFQNCWCNAACVMCSRKVEIWSRNKRINTGGEICQNYAVGLE
uniref:Uncharacterized protein n=1 Tax=Arundo donax TaxID=35708 RepID=A0A0A8ZRF2_ARUDO